MTIKKQFGENGQLMIESMVGISIVLVGLLGVVTLLIRSSQWNRDVTLKLQATYLAAEGIELVKNKIDSNIAKMLKEGGTTVWNSGLPFGDYKVASDGEFSVFTSDYLKFDSVQGYGYKDGDRSPFTRKVILFNTSTGGEDPIGVRSEVSWGAGKMVVLEDGFTFWRKQGTR